MLESAPIEFTASGLRRSAAVDLIVSEDVGEGKEERAESWDCLEVTTAERDREVCIADVCVSG